MLTILSIIGLCLVILGLEINDNALVMAGGIFSLIILIISILYLPRINLIEMIYILQ
ncbi:hypothetical protein [Staphylococcus phage vB_StaM_PB50]|nr:hypothetical protein [Staphylococcus phage vB_StaM_PB50]